MTVEELKVKRKKMMDIFFSVLSDIDKGGRNKDLYEAKFNTMSDLQFKKFFDDFFKSKDNFVLQFVPYDEEPTMEDAVRAGKKIGVSMTERVALKHMRDGYITDYECMVLPLGIKRLQQMVNKKNSTSFSANQRDSKTGQVTNDDKNARVSDTETAALMVAGLEDVAKELLGPRADNIEAYNEMTKQILEDGYTSLEKLPNDIRNKITLNLVDVYFLGAGVKSNLITNGLKLLNSLDEE